MITVKYVSEDWCVPCKTFWPVVSDVCTKFPNVGLTKTNTKDPSVANLGLTGIPVMLFYKNGALVNKITGVTSKQNVESIIRGLSL